MSPHNTQKVYRLSNKAAADLHKIAKYTAQEFGAAQAKAYLTGIDEAVIQLTEQPLLAQQAGELRADYRRYLFQKHIIYFQTTDYGIYVVRVLHQHLKLSLHIS
jgi:toxin ParE1/3/4